MKSLDSTSAAYACTSELCSQTALTPDRPVHVKRTTCRACGTNRLQRFLSLGVTPLANAFLRSPDEFEQVYPLDVYFCEGCSLIQLLDVVHPEILFRDYIYVTGTSETMAAHNVEYARHMADLLGLRPRDLVVEVGSNDGSLLRCFCRYGVRTLGVEPATNIAEKASQSGIETINRFFTSAVAGEIRESYGPARLVIANNVLAHNDDSQAFLRGCKELLGEGGVAAIEVPYLSDLIARLEYDTIYHEHLCYFRAGTLRRLSDAVDLSISRIDHLPVHGGSLRMYARPRESCPSHGAQVQALERKEEQAGLTRPSLYEGFAEKVERHRHALVGLLERLKREGNTIAAYGAPAKGNTLLNYCRLDTRLVSYTVDRNLMKVGLYTPGVHLPVLPVETLSNCRPDFVLLLAWNFAEEILRQQQHYRNSGGRFILPLPQPIIV